MRYSLSLLDDKVDMPINFTSICIYDILSNISNYLSLKESICFAMSSKNIFNMRSSLIEANIVLKMYKEDFDYSFWRLLFKSQMASSYYLLPLQVTDMEAVSNSVHILKVQASYAILPFEICEESLKEIISNHILLKYDKGVITRNMNKAMEIANTAVSNIGWHKSIICLSTFYECLFLSSCGSFQKLINIMDSINISDSFAIAPYKKCNNYHNFINTTTFLLAVFQNLSERKLTGTRKFVLKSVIIYFMYSLMEWINTVGEIEICRTKFSNFMRTSSGKVDDFKSDIERSKMPKHFKKKVIDKLVSVKEKILVLYNV